MDHPGGVVSTVCDNGLIEARWLGGAPDRILGSEVIVFSPVSKYVKFLGKVVSAPTDVRDQIFSVQLVNGDSNLVSPEWGVCLNFPTEFSEGKWTLRAADNLSSIGAILSFLLKNRKTRMTFLLSRMEECGLVGSLEALRAMSHRYKIKKNELAVIALDVIKELPMAPMGGGVIIRHGDAETKYDDHIVKFLLRVAQSKGIPFQEIEHSGGVSESTVFNEYGFRVAGLGIPIGNYHNESVRPEPEKYCQTDFEGLLSILKFVSEML